MGNFFIAFCWIVFILMCIFAYIFSLKPNILIGKTLFIRRVAFLIVFLGMLIYWSFNQESIFTNWLYYLISFGVYLIVDIFFLQGSKLTKFGTNNEIEPYAESIEDTTNLVQALRSKTNDANYTLKNMNDYFYVDQMGYLDGLIDFLNKYGHQQQIVITLVPFDTFDEKNTFYSEFTRLEKNKVYEELRVDGLYFVNKGDRAFRQYELLGNSILLDIALKDSSNGILEETDIFLLDMLVITYDISASEN